MKQKAEFVRTGRVSDSTGLPTIHIHERLTRGQDSVDMFGCHFKDGLPLDENVYEVY